MTEHPGQPLPGQGEPRPAGPGHPDPGHRSEHGPGFLPPDTTPQQAGAPSAASPASLDPAAWPPPQVVPGSEPDPSWPAPQPGSWPPPLWAPPAMPQAAPSAGLPGMAFVDAGSPYPVQPQPYHHFWRAPRWRWWKSLAILLVGGAVFLVLQFVALFGAEAVDAATGRVPWSVFTDRLRQGTMQTTPAFFLANNICLDLLVPLAILLAWGITRQRPGFLVSVTGRVRWGWLGRCMAWILPMWLVLVVLQYLAGRGDPANALHVTHDTWVLLVGILLTTPLQCAGEEFAFRGIINRSVASWFPQEWLGFVAGGVVNSLVFMLAHGAGDPWLNVFYFVFGCVGTWLVRRTGGLEASIAVHVVNNLTAEWTLPFTDISTMFDRGAGTAGPGVLLQALLPLLAVAVISWRARREHITNRATPLAPSPAMASPQLPASRPQW